MSQDISALIFFVTEAKNRSVSSWRDLTILGDAEKQYEPGVFVENEYF